MTFLFNGGPGASSAWLQFGDAGPWRLSIDGDGAVSSASPDLLPNAETWLDFTDLVFIDPVGTGYSRFVATGDDVRKRFFSVDGDVNSIALVIRRWLEKYDRLLSPKFVAGESYGGIRGPKIVRNLQTEQGVGVSGPDPGLAGARFPRLFRLEPPAICREPCRPWRRWRAKRRARLRAPISPTSKRYARGDFLVDLIKGEADTEATNRLADKVARADRHRSGGEPQARRALRCRRFPPRVRPQERQGDRTLRRLGRRASIPIRIRASIISAIPPAIR